MTLYAAGAVLTLVVLVTAVFTAKLDLEYPGRIVVGGLVLSGALWPLWWVAFIGILVHDLAELSE